MLYDIHNIKHRLELIMKNLIWLYLIVVVLLCNACIPRVVYRDSYEPVEREYKGQPRSINDPRFVRERMEETKKYGRPLDYHYVEKEEEKVEQVETYEREEQPKVYKKKFDKPIYQKNNSDERKPRKNFYKRDSSERKINPARVGSQKYANQKRLSKIHK